MQWSCSHTQEVTQQLLAGHCDDDDVTALCLFFCPLTKLSSPHLPPSQKPPWSLLSTGNKDQQGDPARGSLPALLAARCRSKVCSEGGKGAMFAQQEAEPRVGRRCSVTQECPSITALTTPAHLPAAGLCSVPGESAAVPWALAGLCTVTTALPCCLNAADSHPGTPFHRSCVCTCPSDRVTATG